MRNHSVNRLAQAAFSAVICAATLGATLPFSLARQTPSPRRRRAPATVTTAKTTTIAPNVRAAIGRISADSLRGHLSFISSDALEGRKTPSRGLDIAAEYIAAQFRRAGLEPAGDDGYFQTANWSLIGRDMTGFELKLANGAQTVAVGGQQASIGVYTSGVQLWPLDTDLSLRDAGVVKLAYTDAATQGALTREQLAGKVVLTEIQDFRRAERASRMASAQAQNEFLARMKSLGAALVVSIDRANGARGGGSSSTSRLIDPESSASASPFGNQPTAPFVVVRSAEAARLFDALSPGATSATATFRAPAQTATTVKMRNVAGILRGSDPALKDTYVIVSAHYDHLGVREGGEGDRIFNGANDDGSGTVSVIELASALATLKPRPKRSIIFMTFFGEELGLVGSRYYGRHPLVPLEKTVAQVNLEQVGRTDDSEGPQVSTATVTGLDYSDVGAMLQKAGDTTGVKIYKHPVNSDAFFGRSDNQALADVGVPAHTLGVAFEFPDYHAVGDEWQKIDYANMEKIVRTVALGVVSIASEAREPRWNEANPRTAPYVEAWRKLHGSK